MTWNFATLLSGEMGQRIGWTLVHFLWQGILVASLTGLVLQTLRRRPAQARYVVACCGLGLLAALPAVTVMTISTAKPSAAAASATVASEQRVREDEQAKIDRAMTARTAWEIAASEAVKHAAELPKAARNSWLEGLRESIRANLSAGVLLWLVGVVGLSLWHAMGWMLLQRMRRLGKPPADSRMTKAFGPLITRLGVRQAVRLLESGLVKTPVVIGWLKPVILLPAIAMTGLSQDQVEAILAHELAHVRRWDCLVRTIQAVIETVLFFHPAVWWVSSRVSQESENCCDELAVEVCGDPEKYARALAQVAGAWELRGGLAAAASGGELLPRLRRILGTSTETSMRRTLVSAALALSLVTGLIVVPLAWPTATAKGAQSAATKPVSEAGGTAAVLIQGIVVGENGKPVAGALVDTSAAPPKSPGFVLPNTSTGGDGRFTLGVKANNAYSRLLRAQSKDGLQQGFLDRMDSAAGEQSLDVKIVLKPAREAAVIVKDESGAPVAGALVAASCGPQVVGETTSGPNGRGMLRVPADAPLDYVFATKPDIGLDYLALSGKDPFLLAADFATPVTFVLNGTKPVTVLAQDEQHHPLAGARVSPWLVEKPKKGAPFNLSGLHWFDRFTNSEGETTFSIVPADNINRVDFWVALDGFASPGHWLWDPASETTELRATLVPMVPLTGRVVGADGLPVGGATVRVGGAGPASNFSGQVISRTDGTFTIAVDPEQYYLLSAQKDRQVSPARPQIVRREVPATPIELKLQAGIRVHGAATAGAKNKPLPNLHVTLVLSDESYNELPAEQQFPGRLRQAISPSVFQSVKTDRDGRFEFYSCPGDLRTFCMFGNENNTRKFRLGEKEQEILIHFQ